MVGNPASAVRENARYPFAIPIVIELSNGLLRRADLWEALLVDMSNGGAAMIVQQEPRLKANKRYRVRIDDRVGIIRTGSIVVHDETKVRVGMRFERLGLELQEIVADAVQAAQERASRLAP